MEERIGIIHELQIQPNCLLRLLKGYKKSEIRSNDRDYQVGDVLKFNWDALMEILGEDEGDFFFKITHIHSGLGLLKNYVCLSVERTEDPVFKKTTVNATLYRD